MWLADHLKSKVLAIKADLQKEIAVLRYDTLNFIIWTGVGVSVTLGTTLGGMLARGFHWW